jgi:3D (Asp-Asp-Asp) domain-containing protein
MVAVLMLPLLGAIGANREDVVAAQRLETVFVRIWSDGAEKQVATVQLTVGAILKEAGIMVGPLDKVSPATSERPREGMQIKVVRVSEGFEALSKPVPFETVKKFSDSLRPGQVKVTKNGVNGEKLVRFKVCYEDGKAVTRTSIDTEVVTKPVSKVVSIGSRGRYISRGEEFKTRRVLQMSASAYDPGPRSCGPRATGRTGCGLRAGYGVVAVDPRVISLGSRLYIEGYGIAIAGDTGSAIKGNRIDLGFNTYAEAMRFGRKTVTVHILRR